MTSQVDVTATRGLSEYLTALFRSLFLCREGRRGAGERREGERVNWRDREREGKGERGDRIMTHWDLGEDVEEIKVGE